MRIYQRSYIGADDRDWLKARGWTFARSGEGRGWSKPGHGPISADAAIQLELAAKKAAVSSPKEQSNG